ncbi:gas vesicle protein [Streptomyces agglomeratus]|uniref:gas vesicle protein K n=1 Tax=Streptomyces agglomeratus TaxID=285458 RepID=UPI00086D5118|nr:gas vesicle protein K [Streptomyces agglomeratus]OEJ62870.1 gas vesicle protein [Streptomyces agglomeratus]
MPAEPYGPDAQAPQRRYDEVADAAGRAFRLIPAAPQDLPRPGRDRAAHRGARINTDPDTVERDLMKLVLTLVELLRQLMERQAMHRVDAGDLTEDEEERLGLTLMLLRDRMNDLCARYGLTMQDLNLDLGPLGTLLPPADPPLDPPPGPPLDPPVPPPDGR